MKDSLISIAYSLLFLSQQKEIDWAKVKRDSQTLNSIIKARDGATEYIRMPKDQFDKLLADLTDIINQQQEAIINLNSLQYRDFSKNKNEGQSDPKATGSD